MMLSVTFFLELITLRSISHIMELVPFRSTYLEMELVPLSFRYRSNCQGFVPFVPNASWWGRGGMMVVKFNLDIFDLGRAQTRQCCISLERCAEQTELKPA